MLRLSATIGSRAKQAYIDAGGGKLCLVGGYRQIARRDQLAPGSGGNAL